MNFSPAETNRICWKLAYTFSDFYPPEESVQPCLDGLDEDNESGREHERWYHTRRCEVYQTVIEQLYDDGVEVWELARDYVQNGPHPESDKSKLALPTRNPEIDAIPGNTITDTPADAMQNVLEFTEQQALDASTVDEQEMWVEVINTLTNTPFNEVHDWLKQEGRQTRKRR